MGDGIIMGLFYVKCTLVRDCVRIPVMINLNAQTHTPIEVLFVCVVHVFSPIKY